jgi:hypothetical protein
MKEFIRETQRALESEEVQQAARVLAKHNLGICIPHIHDQETGALLPLPPGIVACERDLKVSFESVTDIEETLTPVAWRWNTTAIEVCASCCPSGPVGPG